MLNCSIGICLPLTISIIALPRLVPSEGSELLMYFINIFVSSTSRRTLFSNRVLSKIVKLHLSMRRFISMNLLYLDRLVMISFFF